MNRLSFNNVTFAYPTKKDPKPVINGLSFEVPKGRFLVILGSSGSGKTTIVKLTAGLLSPSSGSIVFSGVDSSILKGTDRHIGYVSQAATNYSFLSVFQNIALPLKAEKVPLQEIEERVGEVADSLGISFLLGRKPKELSLGQQQKVSLARAIVKNPDLYLLDEPFSSLDFPSRTSLRKDLDFLHKKKESTIIMVSHDINDALLLSDWVILLNQGSIVQEGEIHSLMSHPKNSFVQSFFLSKESDHD